MESRCWRNGPLRWSLAAGMLQLFYSSEGHRLALSALLWTTKCHSSGTEMLNIAMLCINMLYARILLPPTLLFSRNAAARCETMHWVHFQRLSVERVYIKEVWSLFRGVVLISPPNTVQSFWTFLIITEWLKNSPTWQRFMEKWITAEFKVLLKFIEK